jgi:hypothetical protein
MSHSSWSRWGVDGRDKPGHGEGSVQGGPPKRAANRYRYKSQKQAPGDSWIASPGSQSPGVAMPIVVRPNRIVP